MPNSALVTSSSNLPKQTRDRRVTRLPRRNEALLLRSFMPCSARISACLSQLPAYGAFAGQVPYGPLYEKLGSRQMLWCIRCSCVLGRRCGGKSGPCQKYLTCRSMRQFTRLRKRAALVFRLLFCLACQRKRTKLRAELGTRMESCSAPPEPSNEKFQRCCW